MKALRVERVFMLFFLFLAKQHGFRILRAIKCFANDLNEQTLYKIQ